ncbi:hypothetical protein [Streptomyces sp. NPDC001985]|uniref:hypothetical protein n=1 Tax=Streptomyces sp. NPDC001985 TaxID=3154406 RepID=UPI00331F5BC3
MLEALLPHTYGPVIGDTAEPWLYWLVPPGTRARWEPHPYALCLGAPGRLAVPPQSHRLPPRWPGRYWLRPFTPDVRVGPLNLRHVLHHHRPVPSPRTAMPALLSREAA